MPKPESAKADTLLKAAVIYKVSADFGRQGFKTNEIIFAGTSLGVPVERLRADDLAKTYHLTLDGLGNLFGTATKSYGRALPKAEQPAVEMGAVSVVAREFVLHEDLDAMRSLQSLPK